MLPTPQTKQDSYVLNTLPSKNFTIATKRLILRPARLSDALALNVPFSDPEVMRYWSEIPHPNINRTEAWIKSMIDSGQNGVTDFVICEKRRDGSEGQAVGKVGIYRPHPDDEIGILLARECQGKGFASEVLYAILPHIWSLRVQRDPDGSKNTTIGPVLSASQEDQIAYRGIKTNIDPRNTACVALFQKFGFVEYDRREKNFCLGGEWQDSVYLRKTRPDE